MVRERQDTDLDPAPSCSGLPTNRTATPPGSPTTPAPSSVLVMPSPAGWRRALEKWWGMSPFTSPARGR